MISAMEMVNCEITRPFLNSIPLVPVENLSFENGNGFERRQTSAGYIPASRPMPMLARKSMPMNRQFSKIPLLRVLPASCVERRK